MGMTLWFTPVTPAELDRAAEDPEWAKWNLPNAGRPSCHLGKDWAGLQYLLDEGEVGVDVLMDGEELDEHLSGWSAGLVADAARTLAATPFETLAVHFDPEKMMAADVYPAAWDGDDRDVLRELHRELAEFFATVAGRGDAAIRAVSY